jgi:hypothetical protein
MDAFLTAAELADRAIAGPAADPDGDDIPNVLEYAFHLSPLIPDAVAQPEIPTDDISDAPLPGIYFRRPRSATDLTYQVETSTDLIHWHYNGEPGVDPPFTAQIVVHDVYEEATFMLTNPPAADQRVFFRVKVTLQP